MSSVELVGQLDPRINEVLFEIQMWIQMIEPNQLPFGGNCGSAGINTEELGFWSDTIKSQFFKETWHTTEN